MHKTGTTTLQDSLALNAARFAACDILVARSGNPLEAGNPGYVGNHNLAFELLQDARFRPEFGTIAHLGQELATSPFAHALISCEDFGLLHHWPERFALLRDAVVRAGYRPVIVAYFREQAAYAQSLYAMFVRRRFAIDFQRFVDIVFTNADEYAMRLHTFDYDRILEAVVCVFGRENVIARAYLSYASDDHLVREFTSLIEGAAPLDGATFLPNTRLNVAGTYRDVLTGLRARRAASVATALPSLEAVLQSVGLPDAILDEPFYAIGLALAQRFSDRFAESNRILHDRFGVAIERHRPPADWPRRRALLGACTRSWQLATAA